MWIFLLLGCFPSKILITNSMKIKLCNKNVILPEAAEEIHSIFKLRIFEEKNTIPVLHNFIEKGKSYYFHVVFSYPAVIQNVIIIASPIFMTTKYIDLGIFDDKPVTNNKLCSPSMLFSFHKESLMRFVFKWKSSEKPNTKYIKFDIYLQFFIEQNLFRWRKFSDILCYKEIIDYKIQTQSKKEDEKKSLEKSCCIIGTPLYWLQLFTSADVENSSWSSIIGVSHDRQFQKLSKNSLQVTSSGLYTMCIGNGTEVIENEIRSATKYNQILNVIRSQALFNNAYSTGRSALFSVDAYHHMISLVTVASINNQKVCYHIDDFSLCDDNCKWKKDFTVSLKKINIHENRTTVKSSSESPVQYQNYQNTFQHISEPFIRYSMSHFLGNNNFEYF